VAASPARQIPDYDRLARDFFEPQLRRLGLADDQIGAQDLAQLEASLEKVNDAIANPDAFGKLQIAFTAQGHVFIAQANTEHHLELGILPLLLERKGQILDRIKVLRPVQQLSELREDVAAAVNDVEAREQLIETIDRRFEEQRASLEELDRQKGEVETAQAAARERELQLQIQIRERRAAIYKSFLERESVAGVVGAVLMLGLALTLIIGMFVRLAAPAVIANAFLLILGYFFGQATTRDRGQQGSDKSS
jgi:hypothetical protein